MHNIDYQTVSMLDTFCKRFRKLYICGDPKDCIYLKKYLSMVENVDTTLVSIDVAKEIIMNQELDGGLIIASKSNDYYDIILKNSYTYTKTFLLDETVVTNIRKAMQTLTKDDFIVELVLAEHCDLNCQMCDHFSPLAPKRWVRLEECEKDVKRLAELTKGKIGALYLLGGEPLLNPELIPIIKMVRMYFKDTPISLYTNGLKILEWEFNSSGNLWTVLKSNNIIVEVTKYPINFSYNEIKKKALQYDVKLNVFTKASDRSNKEEKYSVKLKLDLEGKQKKFTFIQCTQRNHCHVLVDGLMYTCPIIASISHFNKYFGVDLQVTDRDFVDIHKVDSFDDIISAMDSRPDFCRYCDLYNRTVHKWKTSDKAISEWV